MKKFSNGNLPGFHQNFSQINQLRCFDELDFFFFFFPTPSGKCSVGKFLNGHKDLCILLQLLWWLLGFFQFICLR